MLKHFAVLSIAISLLAGTAVAQNAGQISKVKSGKSCSGCNLFQADLAYKDGQNITLTKSRLRQSDLSLSTYQNVNFSDVDLSVSNLFGARFNRCAFLNANLSNAAAVGTYFGASDLTGANLSGANLSGADLTLTKGLKQSQLNQACGDRSTRLPKGKTIPSCR